MSKEREREKKEKCEYQSIIIIVFIQPLGIPLALFTRELAGESRLKAKGPLPIDPNQEAQSLGS